MSGIDSKIAENILRELKRLNETNEKVLNTFQKSQDLSRKTLDYSRQNYSELKENNKRIKNSRTTNDNNERSNNRPSYQNPFEGLDDLKDTAKALSQFNVGLRLVSAGFGLLSKGADLLLTPFKLFGDGLDKVGEMFKNLNSQGYQNLTSIVGYGGVMGTLAQIVDDTTDNYKKMMQQGQLFGGSMLDLSLESAQSRLGLRQFTEMVENSGVSIGVLTLKRFSDLQNSVRSASRDFGQFGYTTEQMIEVVNEDIEARRVSGTLGSMTNDQLRDSQLDLMKQTQSLSGVTGKSMEEIRKQTNEIRRNPLFAGFISSLGKNGQKVEQGFSSALNIFSSLPGSAGSMLGEMLSQGAAFNNVFLSDSGKELGGFISSQMQSLNRVLTGVRTGSDKVEEYTLDTVQSFQSLGKDQGRMRQLSIMASAGDDRAKKILELVQNVSGVNIDALRKKLEQDKKDKDQQQRLKPFTNIMANFIDTGSRIFGTVREFFIKSIGSFLDGMEQSGALANLEKFFEQLVNTFDSSDTGIVGITRSLGLAVGNLLNGILSKENLSNLQTGLMESIENFKKIFISDPNDNRTFMEKIGDGVVKAVDALSKYLQDSGITATISDMFSKILMPVVEMLYEKISSYIAYQISKLNPFSKDQTYDEFLNNRKAEKLTEKDKDKSKDQIKEFNENVFDNIQNGKFVDQNKIDNYRKNLMQRSTDLSQNSRFNELSQKKNNKENLTDSEQLELAQFTNEQNKLKILSDKLSNVDDAMSNKNLGFRNKHLLFLKNQNDDMLSKFKDTDDTLTPIRAKLLEQEQKSQLTDQPVKSIQQPTQPPMEPVIDKKTILDVPKQNMMVAKNNTVETPVNKQDNTITPVSNNINNQTNQTNIDISSLNDIMSRVLFTLQSIDNSLKREA